LHLWRRGMYAGHLLETHHTQSPTALSLTNFQLRELRRKVIYAPCICAPAHLVHARAMFAKKAGAGAQQLSTD
jgi:hypothetical protein